MYTYERRGICSFVWPAEEVFNLRLRDRLDVVELTIWEVFDYAERKARHLSQILGKDPEYFLGLMFDRGTLYHLMSRLPDRGSSASPNDDNPDDAERRKEFVEEFESLTSANQLLLSNFLAESDPGSVLSLRTAPSNCVADVHLVLDTLKSLILLLKCRCGVDGFFCFTRNTKEFELDQQWFFTDEEMNTHLIFALDGWSPQILASELESFNVSVSPRRYGTWLRKDIESRLDRLLGDATRRRNARMDYENYEKAIVIDLHVVLDGWMHHTFACPTTLPIEIQPLETLLHAVVWGQCYFRPITKEEHTRYVCNYTERTEAGSSTQTSDSSVSGEGVGAETPLV